MTDFVHWFIDAICIIISAAIMMKITVLLLFKFYVSYILSATDHVVKFQHIRDCTTATAYKSCQLPPHSLQGVPILSEVPVRGALRRGANKYEDKFVHDNKRDKQAVYFAAALHHMQQSHDDYFAYIYDDQEGWTSRDIKSNIKLQGKHGPLSPSELRQVISSWIKDSLLYIVYQVNKLVSNVEFNVTTPVSFIGFLTLRWQFQVDGYC
jgi:hypothetical protein